MIVRSVSYRDFSFTIVNFLSNIIFMNINKVIILYIYINILFDFIVNIAFYELKKTTIK